jgi:sarcosine oxidase
MNNAFDVIVAGVGSMGSSACYHLAKRGYKVLGLEQFSISHEYGSHAGQSRIIRKAYFENSAYVPLLTKAYENWKALEEETGTQIYFPTGLVYFGNPDHPFMKGVKQSASLYDIELEKPSPKDASIRFPQFKLPANFETLFEPDAGFLTPENAIRLYARQAAMHEAEIHSNEKVMGWTEDGSGIIVATDKGSYQGKRLIITAGAWTGKIIPQLSKKIKITRQFVAWVNPGNWSDFIMDNFPCWLLADDTMPGCYYGFPILSEDRFGEPGGLKMARHYPAIHTDPDNVNRQISAEDENDLKYVADKYFNHPFHSILAYKICLYANSPDENFIIDKVPGFGEKVVIACGFSGHGFKFASVIGEILADLATEGETNFPIDFLRLGRF